jgi:hypothetical protein
MYERLISGLGQSLGDPNTEKQLLARVRQKGIDIQTEVDGNKFRIAWDRKVADTPYYPDNHPEFLQYWALDDAERKKVAATTDRIFIQATGLTRKLDPKNLKDKPWIRVWLRLRDVVMRRRSKSSSTPAPVWFSNPLPASEFRRFEKAIQDLEKRANTSGDPRIRRFRCWIEKLKDPATDDRVIGWSKICPKGGAIGAAMLIGPCDITKGMPIDTTTLKIIKTHQDVDAANKSLQIITYARSAIVVASEMTSLPLENFRDLTDDVGLAVDNLDKWANNPMGGSSAMPTAYRAIKDWIMYKQRDSKSVYSCF